MEEETEPGQESPNAPTENTEPAADTSPGDESASRSDAESSNGDVRDARVAQPIVIPVAGGKGGVGKTFLAANIAVGLAELGHRTIAVDLDLGGSNLHTLLGLQNEHPGIGDFLKARTGELDEMVVDTKVPNLRFLAGEGRTPFMANLAHAQKLKLISRIKKLPADYILLDLASGSTYNTLDFFRMSTRGILVTVPEYPAIMNMMTFLKNLLLRDFGRRFAKNAKIKGLIQSLERKPIDDQDNSVDHLIDLVEDFDLESAQEMRKICREVRPRIVFNMGENPDEMALSSSINSGLDSILSLEADYFGFVFRDPEVVRSVRGGRAPFLQNSTGIAAQNVRRVAERIHAFWENAPLHTDQAIRRHATEDFENAVPAVQSIQSDIPRVTKKRSWLRRLFGK